MKRVIALVGRPNVGKSTLFNRLTRTRDALVADEPGLTRDRRYGSVQYDDCAFMFIDTGGLSNDENDIDNLIKGQALQAIEESDLVYFLIDGRASLSADDVTIAKRLRETGKEIVLILNKTERMERENVVAEFYTLGFSESIAISSAHGSGIDDLLSDLVSRFPDSGVDEEDDGQGAKVAIVGRPNVGKSTLVNRLLGEERVLAYDMPGTTRDSIYIPFEYEDEPYTLIDTAGVRRRSRVDEKIEKFSVIKTLQAIDNANVVILVMDAHEGITAQDTHVLGYVLDAGKALLIAVNKWDGLAKDKKEYVKKELDRKLSFVDFASTHFISALHGTGVGNLMGVVRSAYVACKSQYPTPMLTKILEDAVLSHQPPLVRGRRIKLRYAHQGGQNPPVIVIHGNQVKSVPESYQRYLSNIYRKILKLEGTPVRVVFKGGENPFEGRKNKLSMSEMAKKKRSLRRAGRK